MAAHLIQESCWDTGGPSKVARLRDRCTWSRTIIEKTVVRGFARSLLRHPAPLASHPVASEKTAAPGWTRHRPAARSRGRCLIDLVTTSSAIHDCAAQSTGFVFFFQRAGFVHAVPVGDGLSIRVFFLPTGIVVWSRSYVFPLWMSVATSACTWLASYT